MVSVLWMYNVWMSLVSYSDNLITIYMYVHLYSALKIYWDYLAREFRLYMDFDILTMDPSKYQSPYTAWILGLGISNYPDTDLIFSKNIFDIDHHFLLHRWADRSRKPKLILMFCIIWEMAGNLMYSMGISQWFLLGSRLVVGMYFLSVS